MAIKPSNYYIQASYSSNISTNIFRDESIPDEAICPNCEGRSNQGFYFIFGVDTFKENCPICLGTGLDPVPSFEMEDRDADV